LSQKEEKRDFVNIYEETSSAARQLGDSHTLRENAGMIYGKSLTV
jgi:hypothetical protein